MDTYQVGGFAGKRTFSKGMNTLFRWPVSRETCKSKKEETYRKGEVGGGYLFSLGLVQLSLVLSDTFFVLKCCVYFPTPLLTTPTQSPPPPVLYNDVTPTCPFQHGIGLLSLSNRITRFCDLEGAELSFFFVKIWQKSIKVSRNVGLSMQTIF